MANPAKPMWTPLFCNVLILKVLCKTIGLCNEGYAGQTLHFPWEIFNIYGRGKLCLSVTSLEFVWAISLRVFFLLFLVESLFENNKKSESMI